MMLLKNLIRLSSNQKLSVFLFHKVPKHRFGLLPFDVVESDFLNLLDYIDEFFTILPLSEAVDLLKEGRLPSRSASLTFDDGYTEWASGVVPILSRRSIPATFYITTSQLNGQPLWHERLANILQTFEGDWLDLTSTRHPPIKTGSEAERVEALRILEYHFKYLPIRARDTFIAQLEAQLGADPCVIPRLSTDELIDISNKGFEIGAHTHEHPILALCDPDLAMEEIARPKEILEGIIKLPVTGFAYPNGRPKIDFSNRHIEMVKAAGYHYAVTTQWGVGSPEVSSYQIPRFTPWGPSRSQMSLQLLRNLFSKPDLVAEAA